MIYCVFFCAEQAKHFEYYITLRERYISSPKPWLLSDTDQAEVEAEAEAPLDAL